MQFDMLVNVFRSATGKGAIGSCLNRLFSARGYSDFFLAGTQPSPIMPGGANPGTPSSKQKDKSGVARQKVVVALYNYKAIESGDLSLEKNQEYEVIDDSQEHWWKVKDSHGYVISNCSSLVVPLFFC